MNLSSLPYVVHHSKPRFEKQFFFLIKEPLTVLLLVLFLLGGGWPAWAGPSEKATPASTGAYPGFKPSARQAAQLAPLMVAASRFKSLARTDFEKALLVYTREDGRKKLWALDRELWDIELSQWAWTQFFGAAVPVIGGRQGRYDLVGYYNPYSDVFLITVWQPGRTFHQIVDAQMLMGDWVRANTDELDLIPLWRRKPIHRPVALGLATARSLLAFEKVFASADRDNWRSRLPILKDEAALKQLNDPFMALMLNGQLVNVGEIVAPDPDAKTLQTCRDITAEVVKRAVDGNLEPMLFLMADTLPGTARDLKAIPPEWFAGLKTTGVLTASQGVLVFLSPTEQTTASLCLYFSTQGKRVDIRRIDLVDYRKFYSELKADPSGASGKGGRHE